MMFFDLNKSKSFVLTILPKCWKEVSIFCFCLILLPAYLPPLCLYRPLCHLPILSISLHCQECFPINLKIWLEWLQKLLHWLQLALIKYGEYITNWSIASILAYVTSWLTLTSWRITEIIPACTYIISLITEVVPLITVFIPQGLQKLLYQLQDPFHPSQYLQKSIHQIHWWLHL